MENDEHPAAREFVCVRTRLLHVFKLSPSSGALWGRSRGVSLLRGCHLATEAASSPSHFTREQKSLTPVFRGFWV